MEAMRKSWTDERLDDFRVDMDRRFDEFREDMNRRFGEVDKRFDKVDTELHRVNERLDTLTKAVLFGNLTLSASMIAGFVAIAFALP